MGTVAGGSLKVEESMGLERTEWRKKIEWKGDVRMLLCAGTTERADNTNVNKMYSEMLCLVAERGPYGWCHWTKTLCHLCPADLHDRESGSLPFSFPIYADMKLL